MSDDDIDCDGTKDSPTRVPGTGKELLGWLKPGSSTGSSEEQSTDESVSLDRRTYMLMAGGAAAAAVGGTAGSSVSASGTTISQPDLYGYGGGSLKPDGQVTKLHSVSAIDSVTEVEDNDERATAMEISPEVQVNATLETATVDWFVFGAQAGDPITIEYDRVNDVGITGLILYGPDGSYKNKLWVGTGSTHTFKGVAETEGDHYFQVIDVTDGAGDYSFTVWLQEEAGSGTDDSTDGTTDDDQQPYEGTYRTVPGRIQAQDFDEGGQNVAYYDSSEKNKGGEYRPDEYVDIEQSNDSTNEYSVGYTNQNEWLEYTVDATPGTYNLSLRVATAFDNRELTVKLGDRTLGTVAVPNTGGWYDWETATLEDIDIPDGGIKQLRVEFTTGAVNLNWIRFDGQIPYFGTPGTIPGRIQAQDFDEGGQNVAYYDSSEKNKGGEYRPDEYVDIEQSNDSTNEYNVGYTKQNEWLEYTVDVAPDTYDLSVRVATARKNRELTVKLGDRTLGTVAVPNTGGWYDWETATLEDIDIPEGVFEQLRVEFTTGAVNLNWLEFTSQKDDESFGTHGYGEGGYGGLST